MPECYIEYLNKDKGFRPDKKEFNSFEETRQWILDNCEKYDPDMIKYFNYG